MKQEFQFDKKTGTMKLVGQESNKETVQSHVNVAAQPSKPMSETKEINAKVERVNVGQHQVIQLKRVDTQTPIQLVNKDGLPESYLDSGNSGVLMFHERDDYDIIQIIDEKSGAPLMYMGGYGLSIKFNMNEIRTMDKVEQCLQGLNKLFRKIILDEALHK